MKARFKVRGSLKDRLFYLAEFHFKTTVGSTDLLFQWLTKGTIRLTVLNF